ncbi:hypothetical protein M3Y99_01344500 [Aphelenchoides fujianensis]|nr:hypothetical protein M3Y99_01344500 [Aphelenchoides fujianensis]
MRKVSAPPAEEREAPAPAAGVVGVKREAPKVPAHEPEQRQEAVEVKREPAAADDEEQPADQQENAPNAEEPDVQIKEEPEDGRPRKKLTKRIKKTVRNNQKANLEANLETVTVRLVEVKQENRGEVDQQREEEIAKLTDGLNERPAKIVELEQKVSKYAAKVANQRCVLFEHKAEEPVGEWLETSECEILLLRVKDGQKWAEGAPFDMPNCTSLVHRMDFRPQRSLCEFLHEITKRLPQTVYAQSKALLLGEDNDRLRFEQFAAGNRNVVNSS